MLEKDSLTLHSGNFRISLFCDIGKHFSNGSFIYLIKDKYGNDGNIMISYVEVRRAIDIHRMEFTELNWFELNLIEWNQAKLNFFRVYDEYNLQ